MHQLIGKTSEIGLSAIFTTSAIGKLLADYQLMITDAFLSIFNNILILKF